MRLLLGTAPPVEPWLTDGLDRLDRVRDAVEDERDGAAVAGGAEREILDYCRVQNGGEP